MHTYMVHSTENSIEDHYFLAVGYIHIINLTKFFLENVNNYIIEFLTFQSSCFINYKTNFFIQSTILYSYLV